MKLKQNQYSKNRDDISKTLNIRGFNCMEKELLPSNYFLAVLFSILNHVSKLRVYLMRKPNSNNEI